MQEKTTREIRNTRAFKAPLELVWEVWTQPEHLVNWWGPHGFTNTIGTYDFTQGGEWTLTMHGPDGTNYANRSVFREIIPFEKIVFEHFNPHFITTVLFEEKEGETLVDWTLLFDTAEMRDTVIKAHQADKGHRENLDRLGSYLAKVLENPKN